MDSAGISLYVSIITYWVVGIKTSLHTLRPLLIYLQHRQLFLFLKLSSSIFIIFIIHDIFQILSSAMNLFILQRYVFKKMLQTSSTRKVFDRKFDLVCTLGDLKYLLKIIKIKMIFLLLKTIIYLFFVWCYYSYLTKLFFVRFLEIITARNCME